MNEPKIKPEDDVDAATKGSAEAVMIDDPLRAMFEHVARQPTPGPVLDVIDRLDRGDTPIAGEDRRFDRTPDG